MGLTGSGDANSNWDPRNWNWSGAGNTISNVLGIGSGDPSNPYRQGLSQLGQQGASGFIQGQNGLNASIQDLRNQANGANSVSGQQLQQGLQQNLANQSSMAASASPQNAAMAARNAAMNMGRLGYGLAGQQAIAGQQERNQAQQALGQLQLGQSAQNLQAGLGGYGAALGTPQQTWGNVAMGALNGMSQAAAKGAVASDRRLKTQIDDGDDAASKSIDGLKAYTFKYSDESKHGMGKRLGVMAQDLRKAGLGHAVFDTKDGLVVNGAQLSTSNTAMIGALGRRLAKIESDRADK
jgi:hypothetical protein